MLMHGHSRFFCTEEIMLEQTEGKQLFTFLSWCQVCSNMRNLVIRRPLVLQSQVLAGLLFKYSTPGE